MPRRIRCLAHSGDPWDVVGSDRVFRDLEPRYPEFFAVILDPSTSHMPNTIVLRDDLERTPVDRRNFDALNAIVIAYFESNYRAESERGAGVSYLSLSQRGAKLAAVAWRADSEVELAALRDAILDFFEDAGCGEKLASAATASRLARVVASLEGREGDPARRSRIRRLAATLEQRWIPPQAR